jgi:hypothetical protein
MSVQNVLAKNLPPARVTCDPTVGWCWNGVVTDPLNLHFEFIRVPPLVLASSKFIFSKKEAEKIGWYINRENLNMGRMLTHPQP